MPDRVEKHSATVTAASITYTSTILYHTSIHPYRQIFTHNKHEHEHEHECAFTPVSIHHHNSYSPLKPTVDTSPLRILTVLTVLNDPNSPNVPKHPSVAPSSCLYTYIPYAYQTPPSPFKGVARRHPPPPPPPPPPRRSSSPLVLLQRCAINPPPPRLGGATDPDLLRGYVAR